MVEAVVSSRCPLVGKSIRAGRFRTHYGAAVIAVARGNQRVAGKIGRRGARAGRCAALGSLATVHAEPSREPRFFFGQRDRHAPVRRPERVWISLAILLLMVILAASGAMDILAAAFGRGIGDDSVSLLHDDRSPPERRLVDPVGDRRGAGDRRGPGPQRGRRRGGRQDLLSVAGTNPLLALAAIYLATMICTEMITNNAAAILMFPIGWQAAVSLEAIPIAFAVAVMIAASAGFSTPFGYQTNLMVFGPGGYRFSDFLRFGIPLNLLVFLVAMIVIPLVWTLR